MFGHCVEARRYSDRSKYLSKFVSQRCRKLKAMAGEVKGSGCQICGFSCLVWTLDFHHIDDRVS